MATERRYLNSIKIQLRHQTLEIEWLDEVVRDNGEVLSVSPHLGAFPLNDNGEPDEEIVTLMGLSIKDILGKAFADAQKNIQLLKHAIDVRDAQLQTLFNENKTLKRQNAELAAKPDTAQ